MDKMTHNKHNKIPEITIQKIMILFLPHVNVFMNVFDWMLLLMSL